MTKGYFERVYEIVRKIPRGKVMTYGQIAKLANSQQPIAISPRLVGWALHANKDEKTPCHRVVDRTGRLAPNFAFDGWREQKRRLASEGATFKDEMHIDLEISK